MLVDVLRRLQNARWLRRHKGRLVVQGGFVEGVMQGARIDMGQVSRGVEGGEAVEGVDAQEASRALAAVLAPVGCGGAFLFGLRMLLKTRGALPVMLGRGTLHSIGELVGPREAVSKVCAHISHAVGVCHGQREVFV